MKLDLSKKYDSLGRRLNPKRKVVVGEEHGRAKVTGQAVRMIRELYDDGKLLTEIAKMVDLHHSTVHKIVTRETWRHI